MPNERRYVFDSNTLVSALLLPDSVPRKAFDRAVVRGRIVLSGSVPDEIEAVLRRPKLEKYVREDERIQFLVALVRECEMLEVDQTITECRDPKDDKHLELACSAKAKCIVSGDGDLLVLDPFRGISIVTPRRFIDGNF